MFKPIHGESPRPRTVVYVKQTGQRWHVFVRYPGGAPKLLLSAPTQEEAKRAARGYAARYYWLFEDE